MSWIGRWYGRHLWNLRNEVRKYDKYRFISTGNSRPRNSAWHQHHEKSWGQDSEEQYAEMLLGDNPDPVDIVSVHSYWNAFDRFDRELSPLEFYQTTMEICRKAGKPLFVGEFGAGEKEKFKDEPPEQIRDVKYRFTEILGAIEKAQVPIAALWVYDFTAFDKTWNVTGENYRSYQLKAIAETNKHIRAGGYALNAPAVIPVMKCFVP